LELTDLELSCKDLKLKENNFKENLKNIITQHIEDRYTKSNINEKE